ncbi:MAG: patatin-like phospholipase family protein, partial [Alphaproteobacteria bacterium]|nr:patatin-like phospholipase family protein [Alphaproteobacteria bacterium]
GGGIKGVFPAAFLATLEEEIGAPVAEYFDLIAGTSTGGIIALGLGLGLTAKELLCFYRAAGRRIFPRHRLLPGFIRAKYKNTALRQVLREAFGTRYLGESRKRLLIPSLNLAAERVHLYKTSHHPKLVRDYKVPAVEVALATVAAPTYFPIHMSPDGVPYIDGSMWARNPLGLAVVEAIGVLEWPRADIRILSLGCTSTHLNVSWQKRISLGTSYWGAHIADVFMKAQSSSAIATAHALIGSRNVFRISPDTSHYRFTLDGVRHIPLLEALGREEALRQVAGLRDLFFQSAAEPFTPCHALAGAETPASAEALAVA